MTPSAVSDSEFESPQQKHLISENNKIKNENIWDVV